MAPMSATRAKSSRLQGKAASQLNVQRQDSRVSYTTNDRNTVLSQKPAVRVGNFVRKTASTELSRSILSTTN